MAKAKQTPTANCEPPTANCPAGRPTWAEIDLSALAENYRKLQALLTVASPASPSRRRRSIATRHSSFVIRHSSIPSPRLIPVIKADAYGHGAVSVARALGSTGATAFAVALVEEGMVLREARIRQEILVLEGAWPGQEAEALRRSLTLAVYAPDAVRRLDLAARAAHEPARVHIKIDTGMTRLGIPWNGMARVLEALHEARHVRVAGAFSHLACADEEDLSFTHEQIRRFRHALGKIREAGLDPGEIHLANSAGLLYCADVRRWSARPGIALYGYPPAPARSPVSFRPALCLKSRIGRIHTIPAGESVGYHRKFIAGRRTRAATIPVGYADGYRRSLTGLGRVIIRDRWADALGAVSMDTIVVDITDLPGVTAGEEVILLGSSPHCRMDAATWAELIGTIPYEILCGIGPRVPRIYA